jgi:hypothetical protein
VAGFGEHETLMVGVSSVITSLTAADAAAAKFASALTAAVIA